MPSIDLFVYRVNINATRVLLLVPQKKICVAYFSENNELIEMCPLDVESGSSTARLLSFVVEVPDS